MLDPHPIVLFDGVCNLCNGIVSFVIRRDPAAKFRFASLQSDAGKRLLREHGLPEDSFDTFVMIDCEAAFVRSTAALRALRGLGFPWMLLYAFILVPAPLRDLAYRFIARHRYRWFGRRQSCMVPTPEIASRFLD